MGDIALRCEGLGKRFRRGDSVPHTRFTEMVMGLPRRLARAALLRAQGGRRVDDWFWALRDIDLEVKKGEVLGIVGRNGAGKSTLLKLLSRITEPTAGKVQLFGRVSSLLEVGTGFHPELTGRENIYLNGAVLGMTKPEIRAKFDEIVAFAEVEDFLDTPVKRYSSGMQTRLGFAVAAHLEPEILIIDEVLAVGDAAFQRKCLGKMDEVAQSGRTVLFVSHNSASVEALCSSAVMLDLGKLVARGGVGEILERYHRAGGSVAMHAALTDHPNRLKKFAGKNLLTDITVFPAKEPERPHLFTCEPITFRVRLSDAVAGRDYGVRLSIETARGVRICNLFSDYIQPLHLSVADGVSVDCTWRDQRLTPGDYSVRLSCVDLQSGKPTDGIDPAITFSIEQRDVYGTGKLPTRAKAVIMLPDMTWQTGDGGAMPSAPVETRERTP